MMIHRIPSTPDLKQKSTETGRLKNKSSPRNTALTTPTRNNQNVNSLRAPESFGAQ